MNEEEQFVNIDLNDDNICSVCKLGTDKETLQFCHVCFELNIEGKDRIYIHFMAWALHSYFMWTSYRVKLKFLEWLEIVPGMNYGNVKDKFMETKLKLAQPWI